MRKLLFVLIAACVGQTGTAYSVNPNSAIRQPGVSYEVYKSRAHSMAQPKEFAAEGDTPMDHARKFKRGGLPHLVKWANLDELRTQFERVRDTRWIIDGERPNFLRRPSWMFPDDGCYARAALVNRMLSKGNGPVPNKVFAFGDLTARTENTSHGTVNWWYHVAPVVDVDGEAYVLDPSIEPRRPLSLKEWLGRMGPNPGEIEVAICGSGSYSPYDQCDRDTDGEEVLAQQDQKGFLQMEWYRIEELRRNPVNELGDNPPWKR